MNAAIRIDPETGLKVFSTRAAKASEKITGKGYSVLTDQKLKELPEMPAGATFNAQEQAKYRAFKEGRRGADTPRSTRYPGAISALHLLVSPMITLSPLALRTRRGSGSRLSS